MPDFWRVPQIWDGDAVFIVGGGPSLKDFDATRLEGRRVIAVNCAYRLAQFDCCFFGDPFFVERFGEGLDQFGGLKVTRQEQYLGRSDIKVLRYDNRNGISTNPEVLRWNASSGACAVNLAVLLGAGRIVLLGFDMQKVEGKHNWHDVYPDGETERTDQYGRFSPHVPDYNRFRIPFTAIARDLDALGIDCINACPDSALDCFPKCTIEEALAAKEVPV